MKKKIKSDSKIINLKNKKREKSKQKVELNKIENKKDDKIIKSKFVSKKPLNKSSNLKNNSKKESKLTIDKNANNKMKNRKNRLKNIQKLKLSNQILENELKKHFNAINNLKVANQKSHYSKIHNEIIESKEDILQKLHLIQGENKNFKIRISDLKSKLSSKIDDLNGKLKNMDHIVDQLTKNNFRLKELNNQVLKDKTIISKIKKICGPNFKYCTDQIQEIDYKDIFKK